MGFINWRNAMHTLFYLLLIYLTVSISVWILWKTK